MGEYKYKRDGYIHIRIKKELKDQLMKEAKENNITLNAYVNLLLDKRKGI